MITSCDVYENEISLHNCNENDVSIYSHINMNNEEKVDDNKKKNHGLEYLTSLDYHSTIICTKKFNVFCKTQNQYW